MGTRIHITDREIARAFDNEDLRRMFPPILKTEQVLLLFGIAKSTLQEWISQGRLCDTYRVRGKHRFFWRDRLIDQIFNGPEWKNNDDHEPL